MSDKIFFLGDVYLPQSINCDFPFSNFVLNLEHPITLHESGYPGKVNLKTEREYITETFTTEPLAVNIANNHILDYGYMGVRDTLNNLREIGIKVFGAGPANCNHNNPVVVTVDNHRIGLLGYLTPNLCKKDYDDEVEWIAIATRDQLNKDIRNLIKKGVDRVVVQIHAGSEDIHFPTTEQIKLGRTAAELGADLVIGHHAHCIQTWERYNDIPIFYGLGNFIMPSFCTPSYFDETGESTKRFKKRQHWWNKNSLGVKYDPNKNTVENTYFQFDGGLKMHDYRLMSSVRAKIFQTIPDSQLSNAHTASYIYGSLRKEMMNYIRDPSVITPKSLVDLFRRIKN